MDKCEMLVRLHIQDAKDNEEGNWAEKVGVGAYRFVVTYIANPWFVPTYNWFWDNVLGTKGENMFEHPMYEKAYLKIFNGMIAAAAWFKGSHDYRTRRKVVVNGNWSMKPGEDGIYYVDDMIFVKDF